MTVRVEKRIWSKGSARGAGPQVKTGTVRVNFDNRAADVAMCAHGVVTRRCDDCGEHVPSHPGQPAHVCGGNVGTCVNRRAP
jgi:hypothetical protein